MTVHGYQYVVLRCVPRVEREEFLNVGLVLYSQGADFLEAAFGNAGREVAASMKRPRLSYNVAVYHRRLGDA